MEGGFLAGFGILDGWRQHASVLILCDTGLIGLCCSICLHFVAAFLDDSDLVGDLIFGHIEFEDRSNCLWVEIGIELVAVRMIRDSIHALSLKKLDLVVNERA